MNKETSQTSSVGTTTSTIAWNCLYLFRKKNIVGVAQNMLIVSSTEEQDAPLEKGVLSKLNLIERLQFWSSGKFIVKSTLTRIGSTC